MEKDSIETGLGIFSKRKFDALTNVREKALDEIRNSLRKRDYREVTTSSLVNIAGSCENPNYSFTLDYYGREAHLSQSAQIQLEALVLRLKRGFFTVNNSFREESYEDPEATGRRLSEFTLVEPERPYVDSSPEQVLDKIIGEEESVVKDTINGTLAQCDKDIIELGGDPDFLFRIVEIPFNKITYKEALDLLKQAKRNFGDDLGIKEEQEILKYFDNVPTFVTHYPTSIKFFNMKRTNDGQTVYSVDLLTPRLGETTGGAVREEDGEKIKQYLRESKIGKYLQERGQNPEVPFGEYLRLFEQEEPLLRGGYGIGFERLVAFLLGSNDILETIAYRTLTPQ